MTLSDSVLAALLCSMSLCTLSSDAHAGDGSPAFARSKVNGCAKLVCQHGGAATDGRTGQFGRDDGGLPAVALSLGAGATWLRLPDEEVVRAAWSSGSGGSGSSGSSYDDRSRATFSQLSATVLFQQPLARMDGALLRLEEQFSASASIPGLSGEESLRRGEATLLLGIGLDSVPLSLAVGSSVGVTAFQVTSSYAFDDLSRTTAFVYGGVLQLRIREVGAPWLMLDITGQSGSVGADDGAYRGVGLALVAAL